MTRQRLWRGGGGDGVFNKWRRDTDWLDELPATGGWLAGVVHRLIVVAVCGVGRAYDRQNYLSRVVVVVG